MIKTGHSLENCNEPNGPQQVVVRGVDYLRLGQTLLVINRIPQGYVLEIMFCKFGWDKQ